jgi:hypothetical protein
MKRTWWKHVELPDWFFTKLHLPPRWRYNPIGRVQYSINGRGWRDAPIGVQEGMLRYINLAEMHGVL